MSWIPIATPYPMIYKSQQMGMKPKVLGAVLHTTNHTAGAENIGRFQQDWNAKQAQSAHFVIDRGGQIGQCRMLNQVAWHISGQSPSYIGIEHIAKPDTAITGAQIEASGRLLSYLSIALKFPLQQFSKAGESGVAMHRIFYATYCGRQVFWHGSARGGGQFDQVLAYANNYGS